MDRAVTLKSICQPSEDVVARVIEGEMIIVPLVAGIGDADDELYTLSETGRAIWQALDGKKSLGQVAEALATAFSSEPKEIENDVLGFAAEMVRRGMLVVRK
jgi:hypothetical protein